MTTAARTDELRPMSDIQVVQTRAFIDGLASESQTYWDMVEIGDALSRELTITPELVIQYADAVEDFNPWYEGWKTRSTIAPNSPCSTAVTRRASCPETG